MFLCLETFLLIHYYRLAEQLNCFNKKNDFFFISRECDVDSMNEITKYSTKFSFGIFFFHRFCVKSGCIYIHRMYCNQKVNVAL